MYKLTYRWGHPLFIVAMLAFIAASIAPGWLHRLYSVPEFRGEVPIALIVGGWLGLGIVAAIVIKAARVQKIKIAVTILSLMAILAALSNMFSTDPWWLISEGVLRVNLIQLGAAIVGSFVASWALCNVQQEQSTVLREHGHRGPSGAEEPAAAAAAEPVDAPVSGPPAGDVEVPQTAAPSPAMPTAAEAEPSETTPRITRESRVPPTSTVTGLKAMSSGLGHSGLAARAAASGSSTNLKGLLDKLDPEVKLTIPPDSGVDEAIPAAATTAPSPTAAAAEISATSPVAEPISQLSSSSSPTAEIVNPTPTNPTSTAANLPEQKKPPATTTATRLQAQKRKSTATFTKLQALSAGGGTAAPRPKQSDNDQESDSLKSILDRLDTQPFDDEPVNDILSPVESLLTPPEVLEANRMPPPVAKQPDQSKPIEPPRTQIKPEFARQAAKSQEPTKPTAQPSKKEQAKTPEPSKKSEPAKPAAAKAETPKTPAKPEPAKAETPKPELAKPAAKKTTETPVPSKAVHQLNDDETNLSAMLDNMESLLPETTDFSPPAASETPAASDSESVYNKDDLLAIPTPKAKPGLRELASKEANKPKPSLIKGKSADAAKSQSETAEAQAEPEKSETVEATVEPVKSETAEAKADSEKFETAEAKADSEKFETAEAKVDSEKAETAEAKADSEKAETAEAKADSEKSETAEAKADSEKAETAEAKADSEKSETAEAKADSEKAETAEAKADSEKSETAEAKADSEKSETAEAKADSEKSETAEAKADSEKSETAEAKADSEKSETAEGKAGPEKAETAEAKAEPEKSETAEAKAEPEKSETAEAKAEPEKSETAEAKAESTTEASPEGRVSEEAKVEPEKEEQKEESSKVSIADAFAPEPASAEESALIAEAAGILANQEKAQDVSAEAETKAEPTESKTESASHETKTEATTEPTEAKTETEPESKTDDKAPEAKSEATEPEQKAEALEQKSETPESKTEAPEQKSEADSEKSETAEVKADSEKVEPTEAKAPEQKTEAQKEEPVAETKPATEEKVETPAAEIKTEPSAETEAKPEPAEEPSKPIAETAAPQEPAAEIKSEPTPEPEAKPVEDNLFGAKVDQDIDDIFSAITPPDALKEVRAKSESAAESQEKTISDSFIEIERSETVPDASENVFGQAIDKDIDAIFDNIVPVEAQKEVKDTGYQKPYGADAQDKQAPAKPAEPAAPVAESKPEPAATKPAEPISPAAESKPEPEAVTPKPVAATSAAEIAAALRAQSDTIPPVAPVEINSSNDNKLFEPQKIEKDLDDIFSNIAPEEAHQTVSDQTLAKLKQAEESEMSFEPPQSREERIAEAAKQPPPTVKFNETLARLPSMQGTVEGLLNNLAEMADTDFKPEDKKREEEPAAPKESNATQSKAVATNSVHDLLESLEQENKEHAAQAAGESVPAKSEPEPTAPSASQSESASESINAALDAAQNDQTASSTAAQQPASTAELADAAASNAASFEDIRVKAEAEAAKQTTEAGAQSEEGELEEGDVPLSMRSTVDIATALKDAQKAKQMSAVEKQLKEFGRLSTKAPTPSNEPPGSMKTIGKLLIEVSQIENIIKAGETGKIGGNLSTARVISANRGAGIKELLNKIDSYGGVKGSVIVGHDGLVIASTVSEDMDKDALGALSLHCLGTSNMATQKLEIGKLRQMVLISPEKITVLTDVDVGILAVFMDNTRVDRIDGLITAIHETIHG